LPCGKRCRNDPGDRFACELLPPALRLPVVHDEIGVPQLAGGAEIQSRPVERPLEHQRRVAKRTIGHGNRRAADGVVDDLVPNEDSQRIGVRIVA